MDKPAKCLVQNLVQYNGLYGCSKCLQPGETYSIHDRGHSHVYPYESFNPSGPLRTLEGTINNAKVAVATGKITNGVKGPSQLMTLKSFNLIKGVQIDYMHTVLLGVVVTLTNLWFSSTHSAEEWYIIGLYSNVVDQQLKEDKTTRHNY